MLLLWRSHALIKKVTCSYYEEGHMLLWRRSHAFIMKKVTCSYYEEGHMLLWRSLALIMKKVTCCYYEEGHMLLLWRRSHALIMKKVTCSYYVTEEHAQTHCDCTECWSVSGRCRSVSVNACGNIRRACLHPDRTHASKALWAPRKAGINIIIIISNLLHNCTLSWLWYGFWQLTT